MTGFEEQNEQDVLEYLEYCANTKQNCRETIQVRKNQLSYLLAWAESVSLSRASGIKIPFPSYLCNLSKPDFPKGTLSPAFIKATLNVSRMFFHWAKMQYPERFENLQTTWIDSLRSPRHIQESGTITEHDYYTLDEMLKIAAIVPNTLAEKRGRAAMSFLFLSGMRVGAFLTLPIRCVDMVHMRISQLPSMGVATKFHKAAVTTLLNIPDLLQVVKEWDAEIRQYYPDYQTWFAPIRPQQGHAGNFFATDKKASPLRSKEFRKEMIALCQQANVPFRSAHKLRHGHAMFGIKNAQNIQELKTISQNLMHSSITTTDSIYGGLAGSDFTDTVLRLGNSHPGGESSTPENINALVQAIVKLQNNPELLRMILNA